MGLTTTAAAAGGSGGLGRPNGVGLRFPDQVPLFCVFTGGESNTEEFRGQTIFGDVRVKQNVWMVSADSVPYSQQSGLRPDCKDVCPETENPRRAPTAGTTQVFAVGPSARLLAVGHAIR
ncbi:hypothetical protein Ddc_00756 [Ditylenchus destructor]|nr:hypothetical protein Ddc_00756 [Ditylenchus destructor]